MLFPQEILDKIAIHTDFYMAIDMGSTYAAKKLYKPVEHTWQAAVQLGNLRVLRWMERHDDELEIMFGPLAIRTSFLANLVTDDLTVFRWAESRWGPEKDSSVLDAAARQGYMNLIRYLHHQRYPCTANAIKTAAMFGYLDAVQYLHENNLNRLSYALQPAVDGGHAPIVRYILSTDLQVQGVPKLIVTAVNRDHLALSRLLVDTLQPVFDEHNRYEIVLHAARNGNLAMLEWAMTLPNMTVPSQSLVYAVHGGNLDVVEYIWKRDSRCKMEALEVALMFNKTSIIDFFLQHKVPVASTFFDYPASRGDLDLLIRMSELYPDVPWTASIIRNGALSDSLPVFIHIFQRSTFGPHIDIRYLARHGCLNVIRWLHEHWFESHNYTAIAAQAAFYNHLELVKWACETVGNQIIDTAQVLSYGKRNYRVIRWLLSTGRLQIDSVAVQRFIHITDMELLRDLFTAIPSNLTPPPKPLFDAGVEHLDAETLDWMLDTNLAVFTKHAVITCVSHGRVDLLRVFMRYPEIPFDPSIIYGSIRAGQIDAFHFLADHGHLTKRALQYASNMLSPREMNFMFRATRNFSSIPEFILP